VFTVKKTLAATRNLQAIGAVTLELYCKQKNVECSILSDLIRHLKNVLVQRSLSTWEQECIKLEGCCRGDFLPKQVSMLIDNPVTRMQLERLINCVVEIGMVDMYGASTDEPRKAVEFAITIARQNGLALNSLQRVLLNCHGDAHPLQDWGETVTSEDAEKLVVCYKQNLLGQCE